MEDEENELTEEDIDEIIDEVDDELSVPQRKTVTVEKDGEEYEVEPPTTYSKELGHEMLLNPDADVVVDHSVDRDGVVGTARSATEFAVFLPRETGTFWSIQSDGMIMKHPTMEGTLIPIHLFKADASRLPNANYLKHDNGGVMENIWESIEDDLPVEVEDVPAPDGYAQTQEAIRWVRITDTQDAERNMGGPAYDTDETYFPAYVDWVRWAVENDSKIAFIYRNCD